MDVVSVPTPDYIAPNGGFGDMTIIRGYGATVAVGEIEVAAIGPGLAADLHRAGHCGPLALAAAITEMFVYDNVRCLSDLGEPCGLWETEINLIDQRGVTTAKVWAELINDHEANVFYPHER